MTEISGRARAELKRILTEHVRAELKARVPRMVARIAGLTDEGEVRRVLQEEISAACSGLGVGMVVQARLDEAVGEGLAEMDRLSKGWPDSES